jgi:hypothetical protein
MAHSVIAACCSLLVLVLLSIVIKGSGDSGPAIYRDEGRDYKLYPHKYERWYNPRNNITYEPLQVLLIGDGVATHPGHKSEQGGNNNLYGVLGSIAEFY